MNCIDPKKVPRSAMRFAAAANFQFADPQVETGVLPFRMLGRSKDAVDHYYWGRIVHDLSGMIVRKGSITVDYCHDFDEVIGFANQFSIVDAGLEVAGSLVTTNRTTKPTRCTAKARPAFHGKPRSTGTVRKRNLSTFRTE